MKIKISADLKNVARQALHLLHLFSEEGFPDYKKSFNQHKCQNALNNNLNDLKFSILSKSGP